MNSLSVMSVTLLYLNILIVVIFILSYSNKEKTSKHKSHYGRLYRGVKSHTSKESYVTWNALSERDRIYLDEKVRKEETFAAQAKYYPHLQCNTNKEVRKGHVFLHDNHMAQGIARLLWRGQHWCQHHEVTLVHVAFHSLEATTICSVAQYVTDSAALPLTCLFASTCAKQPMTGALMLHSTLPAPAGGAYPILLVRGMYVIVGREGGQRNFFYLGICLSKIL